MRLAAFAPVALLVALAGCGGGGDGDGTEISIKGDNGSFTAGVGKDGSVAIDAPGFKGSITLPKISLDAGDFEINGVNLPTGSKIESLNVNGTGGGDKLQVRFSSPVGTAAVREWFQGKLAAEGFTLKAAGDNLSGTTDDGKAFSLSTKAAGAGSESTISIGQ